MFKVEWKHENGLVTWLKGTVFTTVVETSTTYATREAATVAMNNAKKFYPVRKWQKATKIVEVR